MVVIDAAMLLLLLRPESGAPIDSHTGKPVAEVKEGIDFLVMELEKSRTKLIVPTPALSEVLVRASLSDAPRIVEEINKASVFEIKPFDALAAIEVAAMTRTALGEGDKKAGSSETWAKVKYDRQIIAIAKVAQANVIYSDDLGLRAIAQKAGIAVIGLAELPLPPRNAQGELELVIAPENEQRSADEQPTRQEDIGPDPP